MSQNTQLITRQEWQSHHHAANALAYGLDPDLHTESTFLWPQTLPSPQDTGEVDELTYNAIHHDIESSRQGNGTLPTHINELGKSPNWNALAGGKQHEALRDVENDVALLGYLAARDTLVLQADNELRARYPEIVTIFTSGVEEGIQRGYIPGYVRNRLNDTTSRTGLRVVDVAYLDDDRYITLGEYEADRDWARFSHKTTQENRPLVVIHELYHKISGGSFQILKGEPKRIRMGFSIEHGDGQLSHLRLTEAIDQHLSVASLYGDFATLDPDKRTDNDDTYYEGRKLLARMIEQSGGIMDLATITRASFEDDDDESERNRMKAQAGKAYGSDAYGKFDKLCQFADTLDPKAADYGEQMDKLLSRIEGPIFGPGRTILEIGSIDIDGLDSEVPAAA